MTHRIYRTDLDTLQEVHWKNHFESLFREGQEFIEVDNARWQVFRERPKKKVTLEWIDLKWTAASGTLPTGWRWAIAIPEADDELQHEWWMPV